MLWTVTTVVWVKRLSRSVIYPHHWFFLQEILANTVADRGTSPLGNLRFPKPSLEKHSTETSLKGKINKKIFIDFFWESRENKYEEFNSNKF